MRSAAFIDLTGPERQRFFEAVSTKGLSRAFANAGEMERYLPTALRFEPLRAENSADFLGVQNVAFLHSPNGAQLALEEVAEMSREARCSQFLQVGYADGAPAFSR